MKSLIIVVLLCFMMGCVSAQRLTDENRKNIQKVYFEPGQKDEKGMMYLGNMFSWLASIKYTNDLKQIVMDNDIHIEKIATESIKQSLVKSNKFQVVGSPEESDARLTVTAFRYGFCNNNAVSSKIKPWMIILLEMLNKDKERICLLKGKSKFTGNNGKNWNLSHLKNNPNLITDSWKAECDKLAAKMIKEL